MTTPSLADLQATIQDTSAFTSLDHYHLLGRAFLDVVAETQPTRIIAPNDHRYIFFQYPRRFGHKITRPLNSALFIDSPNAFSESFARVSSFLSDLRVKGMAGGETPASRRFLESQDLNRVVYTAQQSIGSIGDSFNSPNQARKRIGQLFESFVRLMIQEIGFQCESRTLKVPIPGTDEQVMTYELDLVFSRRGLVLTSGSQFIHPEEIIGSVKTTSKDRLDKVFLDKYMLGKLLGHEVRVVAVFLHDVQRARRANSIFGVNSTFKTNHFMGYTVALNRLDGVYYVDPRPEMLTNPRLSQEIQDFQRFLSHDIWSL